MKIILNCWHNYANLQYFKCIESSAPRTYGYKNGIMVYHVKRKWEIVRHGKVIYEADTLEEARNWCIDNG